MRRTATLSLFAEEKENNLDNVDHLFSINKKCKIELGIVNTVPKYTYQYRSAQDDSVKFNTINYQQLYGDIVWFPLGVFVMFNPSISHGIDGVSISMQLKDKMCLLNGDLGGQIHSSVDFASQDEAVDADSNTLEKNPVLVYNIITQLVNHWGNEQLDKIIISEVPLQIKKVVRWTGDSNIYLINEGTEAVKNYVLKTSLTSEEKVEQTFQPGQDIGFIFDDFIYPGELVCNAGEPITSVLDKIIGIMGNYQYFYDVFGNFVFREKQNYLNMTNYAYWAKEQPDKIGNIPMDAYDADYYRLTKSVYDFSGNEYVTAHNNTLNYNNLKNDFVVWGTRKSSSSQIVNPCRFHLAIDKKPQLNNHNIALYKDSNQVIRAVHYNKNASTPITKGTLLFFFFFFEGAKGQVIEIIENRISKDWRQQIYYQMLEDEYIGSGSNSTYTGIVFVEKNIEMKNNTYSQYYAELKEEFPKIYDLKDQEWKVEVGKDPENIDYFLDFIDEDSSLGGYSVSNIGRRAMIVEDNNEGINCVFEPQIPDLVYIDTSRYPDQKLDKVKKQLTFMGQRWTQIDSYLSPLFDVGGIYNSCFEKIKDLIYQYTHINNTISITGLPIYYLEPNTRITVEDKPGGIYGDYIIQSITLPLDISSTMTINAYQAEQKI